MTKLLSLEDALNRKGSAYTPSQKHKHVAPEILEQWRSIGSTIYEMVYRSPAGALFSAAVRVEVRKALTFWEDTVIRYGLLKRTEFREWVSKNATPCFAKPEQVKVASVIISPEEMVFEVDEYGRSWNLIVKRGGEWKITKKSDTSNRPELGI